MKKLRIHFAILSVIFLVVLAIVPVKDFSSEWKSYQQRFNALLATLPVRVAPAEIGIKQYWVQDLDRVDRCTSCHLGLELPALRNAPEPFRTHPAMYHDVESFGCTICHGGQGLATTSRAAHGFVEHWDNPMLPAKYMQASCAKCHKESDVPDAPLLNLGRALIEKYNCAGCHKLPGYPAHGAPPLDGIGAKVNSAWLVNWLKNPRAYWSDARMPNFMLADSDVNNLADFLMDATKFENGATLDSLPPALEKATPDQLQKLANDGQTIFAEARCISCHAINGKGGYVATDLGKVASKASEAWIYNYIKNPKRFMPGVVMPRFRFSEQQLEQVVAYIETNFVDYSMAQPPEHTPDPNYYEKGKAIFEQNNCAGCHRLGASQRDQVAPDLSEIGGKNIYEIEFGNSDIKQTLPTYIEAKLLEPRVFMPALKMPNFGLNEREARAITVALLGNTTEAIPDKYIVQAAPPSTFAPQGKFGRAATDLACLGCHKMEGAGRLVATDLSLEGSQAQPEWIMNYLHVPYSLRPILTERMPNFFLPDSDRETLVNGIDNLFLADSLAHPVPMNDSIVARGKGLYFERYACQSCHQTANNGGYVGPPLDHVGSRLTPGWIFHWLKNPQAYKPGTIEPNNNLNDADAEALAAYLMTLK